MHDSLRIWAIGSQLLGFLLLIGLRTYDAAAHWQILVFVLMLLAAFYIALLRRYKNNKRQKKD
ncbi:hypothetical protein SAMN02745127_00579 [Oceanospirillum multiglobuliferum]|uniref:Uncharacterized protein n=1 Tax=Oceanospirillum multiglobuliferum TaxID=64969 RepID=A0A1T4LY37_9GAMM|nr:hypothetical protein [Oceanospirillum multiglobuliferum]OPX56316.1 hypothetical protein BTE48_04925 [Oceanospirillum multiglobuliferum]SJZ59551.1 hypothetical protein SAMN02745127_00579 [Oceanospirillum multiglobuliferum]